MTTIFFVLRYAVAWLLPLFVLLMGGSAIALYEHLGEPRALDPVWRDALAVASAAAPAVEADPASNQGPAMEQAVTGLAERLRNEL